MRNPYVWPGVEHPTLGPRTEQELIARRVASHRKWRRRRDRLRWRARLMGRRKLRTARPPWVTGDPAPQH